MYFLLPQPLPGLGATTKLSPLGLGGRQSLRHNTDTSSTAQYYQRNGRDGIRNNGTSPISSHSLPPIDSRSDTTARLSSLSHRPNVTPQKSTNASTNLRKMTYQSPLGTMMPRYEQKSRKLLGQRQLRLF